MSDAKPQYNYEGSNIVIVPTDQPPNKKKKIDIEPNIKSTVTSSEANTFGENVPCFYTGHNTTGVDWSTNQEVHRAVNALHWDYSTVTENNNCAWNSTLVEYCYPQPEAYYYAITSGHEWIPVICQDNLNERNLVNESQIEKSLLNGSGLLERDKNYEKEINTFLNKIKIPNPFHGKKCDTIEKTKNKDNNKRPKPKELVVNQDDIKHKSNLTNVKTKSRTPDLHNEKDKLVKHIPKISSENINEPTIKKYSPEKTTDPITQKYPTENTIQKYSPEKTIHKYSPDKTTTKYSPEKNTEPKIKKYSPEKTTNPKIKKYSPEKTTEPKIQEYPLEKNTQQYFPENNIHKFSPEKTIKKYSPQKTIKKYSPEINTEPNIKKYSPQKSTESKINKYSPDKIVRLQNQLKLIKEEINKRKKKMLKKLIITEHQELKSKSNNKKKLESNKKEDKTKNTIKKLPSVESSKHQNKEKFIPIKTKKTLTVYKSTKLECDHLENCKKRINNNTDIYDKKTHTHLKSVVKVIKAKQQKRTTKSQNINSHSLSKCQKVISKTVNINTKNREISRTSSILSEKYKNAAENSILKNHDNLCVSMTNERNDCTNNFEINRKVQHKSLERVIDITINFIPETMAKNENISSPQKSEDFFDTSFLDDINVDEIVECLRVQDSIPVNNAHEKKSITNEVQIQEDFKKETKPDVNLNACNMQLTRKTTPRMLTDDCQSDFNKVFSLDYILDDKQEYDELGEIIKNIQESNTLQKQLMFTAKEIVLENGDKTVPSCSRENELIHKSNDERKSAWKSKCNSELFDNDTSNKENKTVVIKVDDIPLINHIQRINEDLVQIKKDRCFENGSIESKDYHLDIQNDTLLKTASQRIEDSQDKILDVTSVFKEREEIIEIDHTETERNESSIEVIDITSSPMKNDSCFENGNIESKDYHLDLQKDTLLKISSEIKEIGRTIEYTQDKMLDTTSVCKEREEIIEINDTETERNESSIEVIDITSSPQSQDEDMKIIQIEGLKNVNIINEQNNIIKNHDISIAQTSRKTTDKKSINDKATICSPQLTDRTSLNAQEHINNNSTDETAVRITALLNSVMEAVKNDPPFSTNSLPKSSSNDVNVHEKERPHPGNVIISKKSNRIKRQRKRKNYKTKVREVPLSTPEKVDEISQSAKDIPLPNPVSVNNKKTNPTKPIMVVQPQTKILNDGNSDHNNVISKSEISDGKKPETSELKEIVAVEINIDKPKPIAFVPREIVKRSTPNITPPTAEYYMDTKNLQQRLSFLFRTSYKVCGIIHNGKYGQIYQCENNSGEAVAVKFMHLRITFSNKEKLLKDIQQGVPLEKLNCLRLVNSLIINARWCYIFDYYPKNLEEALKESPSGFHVSVLQHLARQLISAVLVLRNHDIVHSDIKPHHILMSTTNDKLKLCGFDDAYHLSHMQLVCSTGTTHYRAPEIILGHSAGHSVDVWSAAVVLHEMATNMKLFPGNTNNEVLYEQQSTLGAVPADMLNKCLFKDAHYVDNKFLRRCFDVVDGVVKPEIALLEKFPKSARLSTSIFNSYFKNYGKARNKEEKAEDVVILRQFDRLIVQMLNMDPNSRLAIEFVYANPFIYK